MPEEYWGPYTGQHDKIVLSGDPQHDVRRRFLTRCDDASDIANVTTVIGGSKSSDAADDKDDNSQDENHDNGIDLNKDNGGTSNNDSREGFCRIPSCRGMRARYEKNILSQGSHADKGMITLIGRNPQRYPTGSYLAYSF